LCAITDPLSHTTEFTYDSAGNVLTVTNPLDKTWTYTYTGTNDVETMTDPLGRETELIYDENGNPTRVVGEDDSSNVMALACVEHDADGLPTAVVASTNLEIPEGETDQCTGNRTLSGYDTNGWLTCQVGARFSTTTDDCDELDTRTTYGRDDGGRLVSITSPLRQPVSTPESGAACGAAGTGDGEDDDSDTVVDDGCPSAIYTYENQNNLTSTTDAESNVTTVGYDAKGHRTSITDGNRATVGTAESGAACGTAGTGDGDDDDSDTVVDDGCPSIRFEYDAAGRLTNIVNALGNNTTYEYDENSNHIAVTNPLRQAVSTPESGEDCGEEGTGDGVDDDSDDVVDDGCPSTRYTYDEVDRLESEIDALGRVTSYTYNDDSTVATRTDARGLVTEYTYDAAKRLQLVEYMDGETLVDDVDYNYDDVGNRISMVDATGTTSYVYDDLNRLTSVTFPGPKTVAYRYDNTGGEGEDVAEYPGQRTKITYPDSKAVVYTFEPDGRMATVTDWLDNTTTYSYDDSGRLEVAAQPNDVTTSYTYDAAGRLVELVNEDDTPSVLSSYEYSLDKVGNRTQVVDTVGTTTYEYDALYQLTGVTYPNDDEQSYTYDAMGNRLTKDENETTVEYQYDVANQLTSVDAVSYAYDENGNQIESGSDTFEWDHENRLTDTDINSVTGSYDYNGDGLRGSRTLGASTVSFVWDVGSSLPSVLQDSDGNTFVYGLDLISRTDDQDDQEYYLHDGLGSTTGLTDDQGSVTDTYQYDAFGTIRSQTGSSGNEFKFTGEQVDSTGMQYLRARYYDQATGRFLSQDPVPFDQPYSYVSNNPSNMIDPYGLAPWDGVVGCAKDPLDCADDAVDTVVGAGQDVWDARRDVLPENVEFLFDFVTGTGATERTYGPGSREVRDLQGSWAADAVRDAFVANGCMDVELGDSGFIKPFRETVLPPNTNLLTTQAQMGGYDRALVSKEGNGMIRITMYNEASLWSFAYHAWPKDLGVGPSKGPLRTIKQTFEWTESVPSACLG
jgi:RHS repeat-associated protein